MPFLHFMIPIKGRAAKFSGNELCTYFNTQANLLSYTDWTEDRNLTWVVKLVARQFNDWIIPAQNK
jgi:hypothetical protein